MDRSILNKATSADDEPPSGYILSEVAKMTLNHPDAADQVENYLFKKLEKDDANVKLKVLRIIRHVCLKGRSDFRLSVQRKASLIKNCQSYKGPPHPLTGDAPSKAVRDEASLCLKAIFDSDTIGSNKFGAGASSFSNSSEGFGQTPSSFSCLESSGRIQGFGPASFVPSSSSYDSSQDHQKSNRSACRTDSFFFQDRRHQNTPDQESSNFLSGRITGFGNPRFENSLSSSSTGPNSFNHPHHNTSNPEKALQALSDAADRYLPTSVKRQLEKVGMNLVGVRSGSSGGSSYAGNSVCSSGYSGPSASQYTPYSLSNASHNNQLSSSHISSSFYDHRASDVSAQGQSKSSSRYFPPPTASSSSLSGVVGGGDYCKKGPILSTSPGEYESKLVEDLLAPCGAKAAPSASATQEFLRRCQSLECEVIGFLLSQKLEEEAAGKGGSNGWRTVFRVLHILECLMTSTLSKTESSGGGEGTGIDKSEGKSKCITLGKEYTSFVEQNCKESLVILSDVPLLKVKARRILDLANNRDERKALEEGEIQCGGEDYGSGTATSTPNSSSFVRDHAAGSLASKTSSVSPQTTEDLLGLCDNPSNDASFASSGEIDDLLSFAPSSSTIRNAQGALSAALPSSDSLIGSSTPSPAAANTIGDTANQSGDASPAPEGSKSLFGALQVKQKTTSHQKRDLSNECNRKQTEIPSLNLLSLSLSSIVQDDSLRGNKNDNYCTNENVNHRHHDASSIPSSTSLSRGRAAFSVSSSPSTSTSPLSSGLEDQLQALGLRVPSPSSSSSNSSPSPPYGVSSNSTAFASSSAYSYPCTSASISPSNFVKSPPDQTLSLPTSPCITPLQHQGGDIVPPAHHLNQQQRTAHLDAVFNVNAVTHPSSQLSQKRGVVQNAGRLQALSNGASFSVAGIAYESMIGNDTKNVFAIQGNNAVLGADGGAATDGGSILGPSGPSAFEFVSGRTPT